MKKLRENFGFTFMEMMITVVIIGILAAIAIPDFQRIMDRVKLKSQTREVISDIRWVRSKAIATKIQCGVYFDTTANTYTIFLDTDNPPNFDFDANKDSVLQTQTLETSLDLGTCTFANGCIIFKPDGTANAGGQINCRSTHISDNYNVNVLASTGRVKII